MLFLTKFINYMIFLFTVHLRQIYSSFFLKVRHNSSHNKPEYCLDKKKSQRYKIK